ncbi:hypothetical protein CUMW_125900 [Citrus unshiu]|nr:hypothetical protein CUMW_125900 [Citrus unshiu]
MDITVVDQQSAECISHIISLSVPRDACKSSLVFLVYPRISLKTFRVESTLKKSMKGKGDGNEARLSQDRRDEWMKVEMGKYFDENGDDNILASILLNFERSSTKHGLIIQ